MTRSMLTESQKRRHPALTDPPKLKGYHAASEAQNKHGSLFSYMLSNERNIRIRLTGFVPHTKEEIDRLAKQLKYLRVLELGAGTGYLTRLLLERGIKTNAVDSQRGYCTQQDWWEQPRYARVRKIDHKLLQPYNADVILLVWPCYATSFAADVLLGMQPGQLLYYRGESQGGCTADNDFFKLLKTHAIKLEDKTEALRKVSVRDPGINDYWSVYQRIAPQPQDRTRRKKSK